MDAEEDKGQNDPVERTVTGRTVIDRRLHADGLRCVFLDRAPNPDKTVLVVVDTRGPDARFISWEEVEEISEEAWSAMTRDALAKMDYTEIEQRVINSTWPGICGLLHLSGRNGQLRTGQAAQAESPVETRAQSLRAPLTYIGPSNTTPWRNHEDSFQLR